MKILFVYPTRSSFVEKDLRLLQEAHQVRELHYTGLGSLPALARGVMWCDATFSWFGALHAFWTVLFSRFLGKKSLVVAGGYDVVRMPELPSYGLLSRRWKGWCPRYVFRRAHLTLAVSHFTRQQAIANAGAPEARMRTIYHGFDAATFAPVPEAVRADMVLAVRGISNISIPITGLDIFMAAARLMPHLPFRLVGPWLDESVHRLKDMATPNVTFAGGLYGQELINAYSRSKVFFQVSRQESFGCALAEAMLCECVPVVSRRGALPEVVGDCGFYVDSLEPGEVAERIGEALSSNLGPLARERIKELFPLEKRKRELLAVLEELQET
ncbi:MAG: glycosyltransferase family 4 protein [Chloroflexi bacterium]|nr:glycosyltransferase family 4 protein [Chloroflexota bacterium]